MKKLLVSFFALLVMGSPVMAQSKLMNSMRIKLISQKDSPLQKTNSDQKVEAFIHFNGEVNVAILEKYNAEVHSIFEDLGIVTATVDLSTVEALSSEPSIKFIEAATPVKSRMDQARKMAHVDEIHRGDGELNNIPYKGKDVVVGVVDYGFQYSHPAFRYDDNTADTRIKRVWEQSGSSQKYGKPEGFSYGFELDTQEEIFQREYDARMSDDVGHGTHVAGIAAGADMDHIYYGVAPQSDLVFVSSNLSSNTSVTDGVKYVFDYAESVGKPAVVNLSLGSHVGPHDGTSTMDRIMDNLQGPGKIIVGAAGNEGADEFHASKTFSETDSLLQTTISFFSNSNKYAYVDIWGDVNKDFEYKFVIVKKSNKALLYESPFYSASNDTTMTVEMAGYHDTNTDSVIANAKAKVSSQLNAINNKYNVTVNVNCNKLPGYGVYLGIVLKAKDGTVHMWADDVYAGLSDNNIDGWDDGNAECSVGEIGGTGNRIISVGAIVSRYFNYSKPYNNLASFSSLGPTPDGRVKPDITAPGCYVISSIPNSNRVVNSYSFAEAINFTFEGKKQYYAYMQGTSMSSPFVAGVVATWLQADPTLTPERIREVLAKTSIRDEFTGNVCPNNQFGYGKINANAGLLYVLGKTTSNDNVETDNNSLLIYPNPTDGELNIGFLAADSNVTVSVFSVDGKIIYSKEFGDVMSGDSHVINLSGVNNGVYVVRVQGDNSLQSHRLLISK